MTATFVAAIALWSFIAGLLVAVVAVRSMRKQLDKMEEEARKWAGRAFAERRRCAQLEREDSTRRMTPPPAGNIWQIPTQGRRG